MKRFIICTLRQTLLEWYNQGVLDWWDMQHEWFCEKCILILEVNSIWSRLFRRLGIEGRTIIKMDITKIEGIDWAHLTQDVNRFRDLETKKVNFRIP